MQVSPPVPVGWNTWDVRSLGAFVFLPDGLEVRLGFLDPSTQEFKTNLFWKEVVRLGPHSPDGTCCQVELEVFGSTFTVEFAATGEDGFVLRVLPTSEASKLRLLTEVMFVWGKKGSVVAEGFREGETEAVVATSSEGRLFRIDSPDPGCSMAWDPSLTAHLCFSLEKEVHLRCNNDLSAQQIRNLIATEREEYARVQAAGEGALAGCPEALVRAVTWNTIWEPITHQVCTMTSRAWCCCPGFGPELGSYILFVWDTFFGALMIGIEEESLAYANIRAILNEATTQGFLPGFGSARGKSLDRSHPPVGSYCVLKLFHQFGNMDFLSETFPKLLTWHEWWFRARDGNGDGLLEWGSDPYGPPESVLYEAGNLQAAMFESALDNSPMYDGAAYNPRTHTMELSDVGLNSLYALDAWSLAEIARLLGKDEVSGELMREFRSLSERMDKLLWNDKFGLYLNRAWNGDFSYRISPTNFYPLLAGIPSMDRSRRMVHEHLLNEKEFWGEFVLPTIAKNDRAFLDNDYWRGRIWPPTNFLVTAGLRRYGFHDVAGEVAKKSVHLFRREWEHESHMHENYNSISGEGDDVGNSDVIYMWAGLLPYIGVQELIDVEPWSGVRFGSLWGTGASIRGIGLGASRYDIEVGSGLAVWRDGLKIIESDEPVVIQNFRTGKRSLSCTVTPTKNVNLCFSGFANGVDVEVDVNGAKQIIASDTAGSIRLGL